MDLRKVTPGQKLRVPVDTWNTLIDAAQDYQRRTLRRGAELGRDVRSTGIVLVKNASGQDCFRYDILGVDDQAVVVDPDENEQEFLQRIVLSAVKPKDKHKDSFCVLQEPAKDGTFCRAMLIGVTQAWVDIKAATDTHAEPKVDTIGNLVSGTSGIARILWKQSGTGVKLAILRLGGGGGASSWIGKVITQDVARQTANVRRQKFSITPPLSMSTDLTNALADVVPADEKVVWLPWSMDWTTLPVVVEPTGDGSVPWLAWPLFDLCEYTGPTTPCTG